MTDLNETLSSVKRGEVEQVEHDFADGSVLHARRKADTIEVFVELTDVERESEPQLFEVRLDDERPDTAKKVKKAIRDIFGESREFTSTGASVPPVYDTAPISA